MWRSWQKLIVTATLQCLIFFLCMSPNFNTVFYMQLVIPLAPSGDVVDHSRRAAMWSTGTEANHGYTTNHVTIAVDSSESCNKLLHNSRVGGEGKNVHHQGSLFQIYVNVKSAQLPTKKSDIPLIICQFVSLLLLYIQPKIAASKKKRMPLYS